MAASANPSAGGHGSNSNGNKDCENNNGCAEDNANDGGGLSAPDNSVVGAPPGALRHNPGMALQWSSEEQVMLEELIAKYGSEEPCIRYTLIAQEFKEKTARDIALRLRWMHKKEIGKRRKDDVSKKSKDKKEKITDSMPRPSQVSNRSNGPPYVQSMISMDNDDGISFKDIGGTAGQLLEQSAQALDQISSNFSLCKIHENINLFCQARTNIVSMLNDAYLSVISISLPQECNAVNLGFDGCIDIPMHDNFNETPAIMKHMPPLPVKLNDDLANSILPPQMPLLNKP